MRVHKSMAPAVKLAERYGFEVSRSNGGHLRFAKEGRRTVFSSFTPSDKRSCLNAMSKIRQSEEGRL